MLDPALFYTDYDNVAHKIFRNYYGLLKKGAMAIPKNAKSVLDIGIGTGNFSASVKEEIPEVKVYGVDINGAFVNLARSKIPDAEITLGDFFEMEIPKVDYVISSLMTHHFENDKRLAKLEKIARASKGFVNFDIMLTEKVTFDDAVRLISSYAASNFPYKETREVVEKELREKDNFMPLDLQRTFFESLGLEFKVIAIEPPFVVYSAFWPNRKS